ncbi:prolyl oligopeptidase family serine peptidase [Actinosynnema sp. NPDC020468]|uniref:S9 family peptidase n=1 Tax=Actinosynnema sp. NPDC020468 TaxID=3154488 RepID=UPI0033E7DB1A
MIDFEWLSGADPSPDGTDVVYLGDRTGRPQPWLLGGRHVPVDGAVRRCVWHPGGGRLLVLVDPDGREDHRLGEVDLASGEVEWLTPEHGVRVEIGVPHGHCGRPYSEDGALLAYASNARDPGVFDVVVRDLGTGVERTVLPGDDRYLPIAFSPDSRLLLVLRLHQNTEHDLFVCDLVDGTTRDITGRTGPDKYLPVAWTPDSSGVYVCTTRGRDYTGLAELSLTGELTWVDTPDTDVEGAAFADGRLAWGIHEDGYTRLRWTDVGSGVVHEVGCLPPGVSVSEFGLDGHELRFTATGELLVLLGRPDAAAELYLVDLDADTARRLTSSGERLSVDPFLLRRCRVRADDGALLAGLLYKPLRANGSLVVTIHGGPEVRAQPKYDPLVHALLARGIGVLAPDIRGSSGYGLRFQRAIYRDWGGVDLADLAAFVRALAEVDWVDPTRLGVHGASYGGFAALSCLSRQPGSWRAGVSECGPSDLVSDLRAFPPTWRSRGKAWIGDLDDPADVARLEDRSPLRNAHRVTAPLLLLHGENDTNVAPEESERMYKRLKELGRPVSLVEHPGVGHGLDPAAFDRTVELVTGWFAEHL